MELGKAFLQDMAHKVLKAKSFKGYSDSLIRLAQKKQLNFVIDGKGHFISIANALAMSLNGKKVAVQGLAPRAQPGVQVKAGDYGEPVVAEESKPVKKTAKKTAKKTDNDSTNDAIVDTRKDK